MRLVRSKSKQINRFSVGLIALCAGTALVLNMVNVEHRQKHLADSGSSGARAGMHRRGGDPHHGRLARLETAFDQLLGYGGAGGAEGGGSAILSDGGAVGGSEASGYNSSYSPSDDRDDRAPGFLPNGEDGLMILADFVIAAGDGPHEGGIVDAIVGGDGPAAGSVPGAPGEPSGPWPVAGGGPPAGSPGGPGPFGGGIFGGDPGGPGPGNSLPDQPYTGPDGEGSPCLLASSANCIAPKAGSGSLPASPPAGPTDGPPQTFDGPTPPTGGPGGTTAVGSPAPEPSTWFLLIVGFGGLGQAMRIRRAYRPARVASVAATLLPR